MVYVFWCRLRSFAKYGRLLFSNLVVTQTYSFTNGFGLLVGTSWSGLLNSEWLDLTFFRAKLRQLGFSLLSNYKLKSWRQEIKKFRNYTFIYTFTPIFSTLFINYTCFMFDLGTVGKYLKFFSFSLRRNNFRPPPPPLRFPQVKPQVF